MSWDEAAREVVARAEEAVVRAEALVAASTEPFANLFPTPEYPPREWFIERPDWLEPGTRLTITDDGRVAGYFFDHGQALVHDHNAAPKPSPTGYAAFHQQDVVAADGESVRVGAIGAVHGHADPYARVDVAQAHYADPERQMIRCRAYDDEYGGYILGALKPGLTYGDIALLRSSGLSGDWRPMPTAWWVGHGISASLVRQVEGFDCIGPTLVTRPGLPLVQRFNDQEGRAAAMLGGLAGIQEDDMPTTSTASRSAAPPQPPPPGPPKGGPPGAKKDGPPAEGPSVEEVIAAIQSLDARVSALEDAVGAVAASTMSAMEAAVPPLPDPTPVEWMTMTADNAARVGAVMSPDAKTRRDYARRGIAMTDGSFYILDREDLVTAVQAAMRANVGDDVRSHIVKRAFAIGEGDWLHDQRGYAA